MNERLAVAALAVLALLSLWAAPWATFNRETGARAAVLLLPNRVIDFTDRTEPVTVPNQGAVLVLTALGLAGMAAGAALRGRARSLVWLATGALAIGATAWGLDAFDGAVEARRAVAFQDALAGAIANPNANQDPVRLQELVDEAFDRSVERSVALAREAGVVVRRLPYGGSSFSLAAFLTYVAGAVARLLRPARRPARERGDRPDRPRGGDPARLDPARPGGRRGRRLDAAADAGRARLRDGGSDDGAGRTPRHPLARLLHAVLRIAGHAQGLLGRALVRDAAHLHRAGGRLRVPRGPVQHRRPGADGARIDLRHVRRALRARARRWWSSRSR